MSHASYLNKVFNNKKRSKYARDIIKLIKEKNINFDGFVVTGISGIVMGSILSSRMNKDLVIVRKPKDNSHSSYKVENFKYGGRYIFLDDLISSGKTLKSVSNSLEIDSSMEWLYGPNTKKIKTKIVAAIFYNNRFSKKDIDFWSIRKINSKLKTLTYV